MKDDQFPTRENCDPDNPQEFAVWAFVGIPGMKGAPLPFPVGYLKQVSQRMWDAGFRFHPELAVIKYVQPRSDSPHWFADPGSWVPIDTPDPVEPTLAEIAESLPLAERAALKKHLEDTAKELG